MAEIKRKIARQGQKTISGILWGDSLKGYLSNRNAVLVKVIQVLNEPSIGVVGHSEPVDVAGRFFWPKPPGRCGLLFVNNRMLPIA